MKRFLFLFLLFLTTENFAQNLAKISVDTLSTNDKYVKVVIYSDKTWDSLSLPRPKHYNAEEYNTDWFTDNHNAYREFDIASLPDTIILPLIEDSTDFRLPISGLVYSKYGWRRGRAHTGIDIPLKIGDPICTAFEGKVRFTGYCGGYGNLVVVRHYNGLETYYAHLSKILVRENETLNVGEIIGLGGSTGRSTGPHLHFETRYKGQPFDPETIVVWKDEKLRNDTLTISRAKLGSTSRYFPASTNGSATLSTGEGVWHTIKQGDTLGAIARRYGTSVSRICNLNDNLTPKTVLRLGRRIRVN